MKFHAWLSLNEFAIKDSPIHGKGSFSTQRYNAGDRIGTIMNKSRQEGKKTYYSQTRLGKYINWSNSDDPNIKVKQNKDGGWDLYTLKDIKADEELVASKDFDKEYKQFGNHGWDNENCVDTSK